MLVAVAFLLQRARARPLPGMALAAAGRIAAAAAARDWPCVVLAGQRMPLLLTLLGLLVAGLLLRAAARAAAGWR